MPESTPATTHDVEKVQASLRRSNARLERVEERLGTVESRQTSTETELARLSGAVKAAGDSTDRLVALLTREETTEAAALTLQGKKTDAMVHALDTFKEVALSKVGLILALAVLAVAVPGGMTAREVITTGGFDFIPGVAEAKPGDPVEDADTTNGTSDGTGDSSPGGALEHFDVGEMYPTSGESLEESP